MSDTRRLQPFAVPRWNRVSDAQADLGVYRIVEYRRSAGADQMLPRAHANSSSSCFASFRSAVSKPSVNQL